MEPNSTILESTQLVVDNAIQNLKFDQTINGEIIDNSESSFGKYLIKSGSITFDAYSENTGYEIGNVVQVLIPQGDYENKKTIIGCQNISISENFYIPIKNRYFWKEKITPFINGNRYCIKFKLYQGIDKLYFSYKKRDYQFDKDKFAQYSIKFAVVNHNGVAIKRDSDNNNFVVTASLNTCFFNNDNLFDTYIQGIIDLTPIFEKCEYGKDIYLFLIYDNLQDNFNSDNGWHTIDKFETSYIDITEDNISDYPIYLGYELTEDIKDTLELTTNQLNVDNNLKFNLYWNHFDNQQGYIGFNDNIISDKTIGLNSLKEFEKELEKNEEFLKNENIVLKETNLQKFSNITFKVQQLYNQLTLLDQYKNQFSDFEKYTADQKILILYNQFLLNRQNLFTSIKDFLTGLDLFVITIEGKYTGSQTLNKISFQINSENQVTYQINDTSQNHIITDSCSEYEGLFIKFVNCPSTQVWDTSQTWELEFSSEIQQNDIIPFQSFTLTRDYSDTFEISTSYYQHDFLYTSNDHYDGSGKFFNKIKIKNVQPQYLKCLNTSMTYIKNMIVEKIRNFPNLQSILFLIKYDWTDKAGANAATYQIQESTQKAMKDEIKQFCINTLYPYCFKHLKKILQNLEYLKVIMERLERHFMEYNFTLFSNNNYIQFIDKYSLNSKSQVVYDETNNTIKEEFQKGLTLSLLAPNNIYYGFRYNNYFISLLELEQTNDSTMILTSEFETINKQYLQFFTLNSTDCEKFNQNELYYIKINDEGFISDYKLSSILPNFYKNYEFIIMFYKKYLTYNHFITEDVELINNNTELSDLIFSCFRNHIPNTYSTANASTGFEGLGDFIASALFCDISAFFYNIFGINILKNDKNVITKQSNEELIYQNINLIKYTNYVTSIANNVNFKTNNYFNNNGLLLLPYIFCLYSGGNINSFFENDNLINTLYIYNEQQYQDKNSYILYSNIILRNLNYKWDRDCANGDIQGLNNKLNQIYQNNLCILNEKEEVIKDLKENIQNNLLLEIKDNINFPEITLNDLETNIINQFLYPPNPILENSSYLYYINQYQRSFLNHYTSIKLFKDIIDINQISNIVDEELYLLINNNIINIINSNIQDLKNKYFIYLFQTSNKELLLDKSYLIRYINHLEYNKDLKYKLIDKNNIENNTIDISIDKKSFKINNSISLENQNYYVVLLYNNEKIILSNIIKLLGGVI